MPYAYQMLPGSSDTAVYLPMSGEEARALAALLPDPRPTLIAVEVDWNRDLTPWPAPRAFRGGEDFTGGAADFLRELTRRLIPEAEARLSVPPARRMIAGYSLGGLFAVYAALSSDCFDLAASMSGSLWYDGFAEEAVSRAGECRAARMYFSLGDREARTRNPRMARVEECTRRVEAALREAGVETRLEMNPGGHFQDVPKRIARGIAALL